MAKITRAQYDKWNAQAQNGFLFDLQHFLIWNEKRLHKIIDELDGAKIEIVIDWRTEYERRTNEWGCSWNEDTGRSIPVMHARRWHPGSTKGIMIGGAVTEWEDIGPAQEKKSYAALCKLSGIVNTDAHMQQLSRAA